VEEEVLRTFPEARVVRMDLDTTARKGAHQKILDGFARREADILLGTQMVAKGLDFPHVTLVGVISADTQMLLPDFRSAERTFQLLTQVSGRAGRGMLGGEVVIQTHQSDHYVLRHVVRHDYRSFFNEEVASRQELGYPPYARFVLIETRGEKEEEVRRAAEAIAERLRVMLPEERVLGPAPAVLARIQNQFRWHLILKAPRGEDPVGARSRDAARQALRDAAIPRSVRCTVDVDPVGML
jgi:primosomal protein N' (replication factor Y)